jgi:hypothetical protein
MNSKSISHTALFITLALLAGLFGWLRWLEPYAPGTFPNGHDIPLICILLEQTDAIASLFASPSRPHREDEILIPLSENLMTDVLAHTHPKSEPLAVITLDKLYYIDREGYLIGPADAFVQKDLPVITGKDFKVDVDKWRFGGDVMRDGLEFLKRLQKSNSLVYALISELNMTQQSGVIAYTSISNGVPLVLGKGQMERKVNYLNALLDGMGNTTLLDNARYLDFRIEGQIILKKNS